MTVLFFAAIWFGVLLTVGLVYWLYLKRKRSSCEPKETQRTPTIEQGGLAPAIVQAAKEQPLYRRKLLLTKNEWLFYQSLKSIADKYDLHVLSKIRMADLVEPLCTANRADWYRGFAKIRAKHVDFALTNPSNLYVLLLIELDDISHLTESVMIRDKFVDSVYQSAGLPILHISSADNLEDKIVHLLNLAQPEQNKVKS